MQHPRLRRALVALTLLPVLLANAPSMADAAIPADADGPLPHVTAPTDFPPGDEGYHTYGEMVSEIHAVAAAHPHIVRLFTIGKSYLGRDLWAAEVSDHVGVDEGETEILFDGLHHADEHMAAEMPLAILHWLTDDYGSKPSVTQLVDRRRIWIVFIVNPDGGEFDISGGHYHEWRKNRQPTPGNMAIGTDINRNYGYKWGCCGGSSTDPFNSRYRGPHAWSTPEARAIRDFVKSRVVAGRQRITVNISFHTSGRLVLYPFGYTTDPTPPDMPPLDHKVFVKLADAMALRNGYTAEQGSALAITDGSEGSWLYGSQHIFGFVLELTNSDYPPDEQIAAETERNRTAILYLISHAPCPYAVVGRRDMCPGGGALVPVRCQRSGRAQERATRAMGSSSRTVSHAAFGRNVTENVVKTGCLARGTFLDAAVPPRRIGDRLRVSNLPAVDRRWFPTAVQPAPQSARTPAATAQLTLLPTPGSTPPAAATSPPISTPNPVPSPTPTATTVAPGLKTVTYSLSLYSEPLTTSRVRVTASVGSTVTVLEGNHASGSEIWYLVQLGGDAFMAGSGFDAAGWVSENRLLNSTLHREARCVSNPSLSDVATLGMGERLACYGDTSLTFRPATVVRGARRSSPLLVADWMNSYGSAILLSQTGHTALPKYKWLEVTGRFDQAPELGCRPTAVHGEPDLEYLECRERFLVTRAVRTRRPDWEVAGRWRRIAPAPIPGGFVAASAWTGREMLVMTDWNRGVAAYDPRRDQWRTLPGTGLPGRADPAAVWTGREWFIWGGIGRWNGWRTHGATFDPARNRWSRLPPAPILGDNANALRSGHQVIVSNRANDLASFDMRTRTWARLASIPLREGAQLFAVSGGLLAIESMDIDEGPLRMSRYEWLAGTWSAPEPTPLSFESSGGVQLAGHIYFFGEPTRKHVAGWVGGTYDIAGDRWSQDRLDCSGITTGVVDGRGQLMTEGSLYDPSSRACARVPRPPERSVDGVTTRESPACAWTGREMILWSGGTGGDGVPPPNDGVAFRPAHPPESGTC